MAAGCCASIAGSCPEYSDRFEIEVRGTGSGVGHVTSADGMSCTVSPAGNSGTCLEPHMRVPNEPLNVYVLEAQPEAGSVFLGWRTFDNGFQNPCTNPAQPVCEIVVDQGPIEQDPILVRPHFGLDSNDVELRVVLDVEEAGSADDHWIAESDHGGIWCTNLYAEFSICSAWYGLGDTVTIVLDESASGGRELAWQGCTSQASRPACAVVLDAPRVITADETLQPGWHLLVDGTGAGSGAVSSTPAGLSCVITAGTESGCLGDFYASSVTLTPSAAIGSVFAGWSGSGCSGTATCVVTPNANVMTVTATFDLAAPATHQLTVSFSGTGPATITSSPAGINCLSAGSVGNACSASFPAGTSVTLSISTGLGYALSGWSGGGCSGTGTCTVVMSGPQSVQAALAAVTTHTLSVRQGTSIMGSGVVTSNPAGINCQFTAGQFPAGSCIASYAEGTVVTLTATPTAPSTFATWLSAVGCSSSSPVCQVPMTEPRAVDVIFNP